MATVEYGTFVLTAVVSTINFSLFPSNLDQKFTHQQNSQRLHHDSTPEKMFRLQIISGD